MSSRSVGPWFAVALAVSMPVLAQTSSVNGKVVDDEGNPVTGVVLTYSPESNPTLQYPGKTNKKGKYFIDGLFTGKEDDSWNIKLELEEGFIVYSMSVESRTANRVLIGDPRTVDLKRKSKIPAIKIRPLGQAKVDFRIGPPEVVEQIQVLVDEEGNVVAEGTAAEPAKRSPWELALGLAGEGDLEGSVEHFEKAIENKPDDDERLRAFAQVLYRLERYDEAEEHAQRAVELVPEFVDGYMVLYTIYVGKGDLEQAAATLGTAKDLAPTNLRLWKQIAFVARENGNRDEEIAAYEKIVELDPGDSATWASLGGTYAEMGDQARSEAAYQKVTELDPENAHQSFFNLGALQMNNDQTDKAIVAFKQAISIKPDYAQAHRELAFAMLNVGDKTGAAEHLQEYVNIKPDAADAAQMKALVDALAK